MARAKKRASTTPLRIMHEHLGQTRALTPAGKTPGLPVAERLFG